MRTKVLGRLLAVLALTLSTLTLPATTEAQAVNLHCNEVPMGALAPARPIWCEDTVNTGPSTFVQGANSWVDEWQAGLNHGDIGAGYRTYEGGDVVRTTHFRHGFGLAAGEHWMVDIAGLDTDNVEGPSDWDVGGALMRPDRSFRFENGKLVVEARVAAGVSEYGGAAWPELVVSTAPAPTGNVVDSLYAYGQFGGAHAVGCRLQSSRVPICALYEPGGVRVFEISHFQHEGAQVFGGGPFTPELDAAWNVCEGTDPDTNCRDLFRWELTRDTLTLYVNGVKYMEHAGLPLEKQLPDALVNGDVYVYFADWIFKPGRVVRFHWDRTAVNPGSAGPPPTPTVTPSSVPPTPTSTPAPPTPSPTATPTQPALTKCERVATYSNGTETRTNLPLSECGG